MLPSAEYAERHIYSYCPWLSPVLPSIPARRQLPRLGLRPGLVGLLSLYIGRRLRYPPMLSRPRRTVLQLVGSYAVRKLTLPGGKYQPPDLSMFIQVQRNTERGILGVVHTHLTFLPPGDTIVTVILTLSLSRSPPGGGFFSSLQSHLSPGSKCAPQWGQVT